MSNLTIRPIIGMETHVQLATRTKMFCGCPVEFGAEPNSRVCPVCLGLPGALPVINRRAVDLAIRMGLALNCRIATFSKWDRKSYYYPDLPKNYQISQYDLPIAAEGHFELPPRDAGEPRRVRIRRAHLEEDAGKNLHEGLDHTRVDLNRAGTPLLEIVTEPDLASADEAFAFASELQRLAVWLGVSEGVMQKGQMRFEPNVNVAITFGGVEYRTPIAEIKNLNSFRAIRNAIAYEIDRQVGEWRRDHDYTLEKCGKLNLGWDDDRGVTEFQRSKEEAHDYRYFPDPDLVPVTISAEQIDAIRSEIGELPLARQERLRMQLALTDVDAATLTADRATSDLLAAAIAVGGDPKTLCKQFISFWSAQANARSTTIAGLGVSAPRLAELANLTRDGTISATAAATVAQKMLDVPAAPREIAAAAGLLQVRDEAATREWVEQAVAANPQAVRDAKENPRKRQAAAGFLRGQVMKISGGKANPKLVGELIERRLAEP
ncbi:MAG: Asp-tRNA(Asn)/Glu-tRNA(Gln) amidotransferase subunit GatB [Phycisphaerae bacterium]|nr:Asp-tRNA(Asn)/Glu-tRNA(Gln) amidotransferase subunit GatB [Phycisphaerae bacterium]